MLIAGLNKTTLLDYPGRVAATIFTGGCNFRCPFCHNAGLVLTPSSEENYSKEDVFSFLKKRKNILQGVCITGGEPTLQADLPDFIKELKKLGYAVKLDTNGYHPRMLKELLDAGLLDYVAMDIKNAPAKYGLTTGTELDFQKIEESVELLKTSGLDYEFRTTVVRELHDREDLQHIGQWIRGCPKYFLQQFTESEAVIGMQSGAVFHAYDREEMEQLAEEVQQILGETGKVQLRGVV